MVSWPERVPEELPEDRSPGNLFPGTEGPQRFFLGPEGPQKVRFLDQRGSREFPSLGAYFWCLSNTLGNLFRLFVCTLKDLGAPFWHPWNACGRPFCTLDYLGAPFLRTQSSFGHPGIRFGVFGAGPWISLAIFKKKLMQYSKKIRKRELERTRFQ